MFGNKKKENIQDDKSTSIISVSTSIKGDIDSHGSIRLDGSIIGNLSAKARIVLGSTASVTGNIASHDMEISGNVNGIIKVEDILILTSTSTIHGDIFTSKLIVEEGAQFDGKCAMGKPENVLVNDHLKIAREDLIKE